MFLLNIENIESVFEWEKVLSLPAAILVLVLILYFLYRALPVWKEIKLAEIKVREKEAESRTYEASIFGKLSDALHSMSGFMERVTIDQKRDTEKMYLLQRVNADASDKMLHKLDGLDEIAVGVEANSKRLEHLEEKCELFEKKLTEINR